MNVRDGDGWRRVRTTTDRVLERIQLGEHLERYETVHSKKDGRLIDVSLTLSPMRDSSDGLSVPSRKH